MSDGPRSGQLVPAEHEALEQVQALAREGEAAVPRLLDALSTSSWVVRRELVAVLGRLGRVAASAICASLVNDRTSERRLAALVDAFT